MKKMFSRGIGIMLVSLFFVFSTAEKTRAQDVTVSFQSFYDNLSPYGQWVSDPQYGNVWVPNEGGDFRPYGSRGRWVMTDYGNTWVSDDPWGWAVYHYGRWTYDNYYGWVWVPGYEWAPAWVTWRYGGGYSGWAPMAPGINVGISYNAPVSWWIFVQPQYMYVNNCYSYWRGPSYNNTYIRQTTIINNYYVDNNTRVRYNYGPRADVIQRDTRQPVQVHRISNMNRPGAPSVANNRVSMYRPNVDRNTRGSARPSNVMAAPRQIGRPEAANNVSAGRQPEFRQHVQQQQGRQNPGSVAPGGRTQPQQQVRQEPQQGRPQAEPNRGQPQGRPEQQGRPQAEPNRGQPQGRPEQGRPQQQARPQEQPQGRPQMNREQPHARPQEQFQGRPQMNREQPQGRPQQEYRPQPQARPQEQQQGRPQRQQMNREQPQGRPQQMSRPQQMPQQQARPQMQQPQGRPQMQPQGRPQEGPGREGGGRR